MADERTFNAVKTHVPLAVLIAAVGITATVLIKGDAMVKSSVESSVNAHLSPVVMRLDALERRVDEIKATQVWVVQNVQQLAVEQARLMGAERARRALPPPTTFQ